VEDSKKPFQGCSVRYSVPVFWAGERAGLDHVARFSFAYHDILATQPAFVPRPLNDDDLTFDPKTLTKKPPQSADITATTFPGDSEDEPVETGFSLGD
jgi:hypothetical protein